MAYIVGELQKEFWEEPCMSCFKQIHYTKDDILHKKEVLNEDVTIDIDYIICPSCEKEMEVHKVDTMLC
jgi:hypothetical protein